LKRKGPARQRGKGFRAFAEGKQIPRLRLGMTTETIEWTPAFAGMTANERPDEANQPAPLQMQAAKAVKPPQKLMNNPPFTGMFAPVMNPASSSTRNATVRAISDGLPSRPTGTLSTMPARISSDIAITSAVSQ